ncbi:SDR family oxidoreductase [Streptomyces sp. LBL]|uniref:SDR family oxidoreductase n=1 Tax=Streptomyces sp. LBL TaxID=2940562 RepID=UPI0024765053|nr:SDR family oxidoreductase [Streptomyces sp. LBL]
MPARYFPRAARQRRDPVRRRCPRRRAHARQARAAQIPMGRFAEPEEVAATIAFLTDAANRYLTGLSLDVAGGARLGMGS